MLCSFLAESITLKSKHDVQVLNETAYQANTRGEIAAVFNPLRQALYRGWQGDKSDGHRGPKGGTPGGSGPA